MIKQTPLLLLVLLVSACHPWFKSRPPWADKPDPNQTPVLTNSNGERYRPGTPSWVPIVDDCLRAGGNRTVCIESLPPEELRKFREWEARNARGRYGAFGTR